jgi:hypothetical protein
MCSTPRQQTLGVWKGHISIGVAEVRTSSTPGEITRRLHLEEWHQYMRFKDEKDETQSQMDDVFTRVRNEIGGMERHSKEFKLMVDELVRMLAGIQRIENL